MKSINVTAKKVKNGYFIPDTPEFDLQSSNEVDLEIKIIRIKGKTSKEKSYKEIRDEAILERFEKKEKTKMPAKMSDSDLDSLSDKFDLQAESVEDLLRL